MSSRIFRMWPALGLALVLLMAAVWYFAGSSGAHAQTTAPEMTLTPRWQWMGDTVTLSASGFTPGVRAWAHVLWSPDEVPTCRDVSVVENQVGDDLVEDDGTISFTLTVATPGFQAGDHNYLCLVDREGLGIDLRPERLRVVEPPPVYRMRLDVDAIEQAPDIAYTGLGPMPRNFAVVDGRHSDNWNLPQRRGFFAAQSGGENADYGIDGVNASDSGVVVIPAGDVEATIPVRVLDDDIVESHPPETVIATLSDLDAYKVSTELGKHTLHVQDNDALHVGTAALPLVTFAQISQRVGEDVGTRNVVINLSPAPASNMTILYQVSGTAEEGDAADFTISNSGFLTVDADSSSVSIPVVVRDDADDETDETVVLLLRSADGYYVGNTPQHTLTISDNDDPAPVLTVSASGSAVNEGQNIVVTVHSDRAVSADLNVSFKVDDVTVTSALVIPAGGRSATHTVSTTLDTDDAPDAVRKFEVVAGDGYILGDPSSVSVTVRDTQPTVVSMTRDSTGGVTEGNDVAFSVSLSRELAEGEVVDVPLRASGVSLSDVDELSLTTDANTGVTIRGSGLNPVVRFGGAGAEAARLKWHIRTDTVAETGGERMTVALQSGGSGTNVSGGTELHATVRFVSVTISDKTSSDPIITVVAQSDTLAEGGSATFRIVANPGPALGSDLLVHLNVVDVPGSDFVGQDVEGRGSSGNENDVTITGGTTSATFTLATLADSNDEPSGDVEVRVVAGSGYEEGSPDRVRVVDDDATRVALSLDGVTNGVLREGTSPSADLVVTLERALEREEFLTVRLSLSGDVTTADYRLSCGMDAGVVCSGLDGSESTMTFTGPSARVGKVEFRALDDGAVVEHDLESVVVDMSLLSSSGLDGGASLAGSQISFSVEDSSSGVPTVAFERSEFYVMEDVGTHALKLTLSKPLEEDLRVSYTLSGTATRDSSLSSVQGKLVDTHGQWYRCEDRLVADIQVGCSWDLRPDGNTNEDEVYLARVPEDAPSVKVPGDVVELQLALVSADLGVRKAAERYVVFWGPVDIWLLGGTGGVGPQDFVIQSEHLAGLNSRPVLENELDENGVFTLSLDRGSANYRGDTFVAVVPCNDDYLEGKFSGAEFDRVQLALRDCNEPAVEGLPGLAGDEAIPAPPAGDRDRSLYGGVTTAWSQHDPLSGLGLSCVVEITSRDDGTFHRTIRCDNNLKSLVTVQDYERCMAVLSETTPTVESVRRIRCGMGHYDRPVGSFLGSEVVWGTTRYNAARSFYGFVLNWQRGGGGGPGRPGCDVDLLPYRVVEGVGGDLVRHVGSPMAGAREWLTGEVGGEADLDCVAGAGVDELDVVFYTPEAGTDEDRPPWTDFEQRWHNSHPVHFAVYVSGMASEYADSGHVANGEDDLFPAGWRRVSLGSWEVAESDPYRRARGFTTLGLWYPHSEEGRRRVSDGVRFPSMEVVSAGKALTVPRDFAGPDGAVRLFVVPCVPLYSEDAATQGACEDLPARVGPLEEVSFESQPALTGPFGFDRDNSLIRYSRGVTVIFRTGAWDDVAARPVSWPAIEHEPAGDCGIKSVLPSGGTPADVYWREVAVLGGACDRSDLSLVPVRLSNVDGAASDKLVVYVTGGRTDGLDKVRMERAGPDPASYGRLGLRERELTIAGGTSETLHISPDLANREDEVWLVAYSCGPGASHGAERCPRVRRNRDTIVYDVTVPPAFVIRVRFTPVAQLRHTELAPVCQGADCDIEVGKDVPVLREAVPDAPGDVCGASSYPSGPSGGLIYWPDRVVGGGACDPDGLEDVEVAFHNATDVGGQRFAVYATGGRGPGLERVQVKRAGQPAGRVGLRRVEFTLGGGGTGRVLVTSDLADAHGRVLLLAYLCSDADGCPGGVGNDGITFEVDRRPHFQVVVDYDEGFLTDSGLSICRGDRCSEVYPLGTVSHPSGDGCAVSASYSAGRVYWPGSVVAEGGCDRDTLDDFPVTFGVPASATSGESLTVYVTGGRSPGLGEVRVKRASAASSTGAAGLDYLVHYPFDLAPYSPDVSSGLANLAPVSSLVEAHDTQYMRWLQSAHPGLYSELEAKSWVSDGLDAVKKRGLDALLHVARMEPDTAEAARRIAGMPFLESFDELDYLTLWGLWAAGVSGSPRADVSQIYDILDHVRFLRGVSDADRLLVMGVTTMSDRGKVRARLTQGYPVVDHLDRSGYTVTVVRPVASDHSYVLGHLADSVEAVQREMGIPFPVRNVVLYMDDDAVLEDAAGVNYGYAISGHTKYELAEGTREASQLKSTIIHEVAHYYWRDARPWINEGLASAFEVMVGPEFGLGEDVTINKKDRCALPNLRSVVGEDWRHYCNYYLGQRLFLALREELGPAAFGDALRVLYGRIQDCRDRGGTRLCATIDEVRAAFPLSVRSLIDAHWGTVAFEPPPDASDQLGRLGVREVFLTVEPGAVGYVRINPDLAGENGDVWLFAYRCDVTHGDAGCPLVERPVVNGYDLHKGPDFAVRVRFTDESGLTHSTLGPVCHGNDCSPTVPVLREASPADDVGVGVCGASSYLGGGGRVYWPDRVIQGGACDRSDLRDVPVSINNVGGGQGLVLYATGGRSGGLELVRPRRGGASADVVGVPFGRMGLRHINLSVGPGESKTVPVGPDLADSDGNVWLLAYLCDDGSCPSATLGGDLETYAVERRPLFQLRVRFTPEAGLRGAGLSEVCRGQECDIPHPWLRSSGPSGDPCRVGLGTYWPDRMISGGSCWFRGTRYGTVSFENLTAAEEKFVVYSTGDAGGDFGALPVYGVLRNGGDAGRDAGVQLGRVGLRENRLTVASGDSAEVYFRSEMAGDDGDVWLFVYRCLASHGDAGCPLVGRDAVRPEYDIGVRPTFVVRAGFVEAVDVGRSTLDIDCSAGDSCVLTAVFRDSDGNALPGTAEFRVDGGALGAVGSTAVVSQVGHVQSGDGFEFVETLRLPVGGGIVNVTVELLGDGATLRGRAGRAASLESLSVSVMRCADDEASCHSESLVQATSLNRGDRFVVAVRGLDAAGDVGLDAGLQAEQRCTDGIVGDWPAVRLSTAGLRSHPYGTGQLQDRGYAGCAYRVTDDADFRSHGYTVTYSSGGATLSASGAVTVVRGASDLSLLGLTGPAQIESGATGTFHVVGYNAAGLPVSLTGGCVAVDVSGELMGDDDCATTGLPATGFAVEVTASEGVVLRTDSSVGVSYRGLSVRRHVLVVPAADDGGGTATPPVPSGDSGINGLTITPDGSQLRVNWTSTLNADFESLRAQVWVRVGDEDVFLPGCLGGEVHDVSTVEVFCMLSHGQSGDVYHAAVGFIRGDRTAAPVETVQWIRP